MIQPSAARGRTLAATRRWYERLYRLLPDITFDVETVWISGGPWRTLVIAEWNESNSGTDGVRTVNHGIHALELRWGRVARVFIYPDTRGLKRRSIAWRAVETMKRQRRRSYG